MDRDWTGRQQGRKRGQNAENWLYLGMKSETYLRNCDLAVDGSPTTQTLTSPRRLVPVLVVCEEYRVHEHKNHCTIDTSPESFVLATGCSQPEQSPRISSIEHGYASCVRKVYLVHATKEHEENSFLYLIVSKDIGCDARDLQQSWTQKQSTRAVRSVRVMICITDRLSHTASTQLHIDN